MQRPPRNQQCVKMLVLCSKKNRSAMIINDPHSLVIFEVFEDSNLPLLSYYWWPLICYAMKQFPYAPTVILHQTGLTSAAKAAYHCQTTATRSSSKTPLPWFQDVLRSNAIECKQLNCFSSPETRTRTY